MMLRRCMKLTQPSRLVLRDSHYYRHNALANKAATNIVLRSSSSFVRLDPLPQKVTTVRISNHNNGSLSNIPPSSSSWIKKAVLTAAASFAVLGYCHFEQQNSKTECCGIAGVVGKQRKDAREFLLDALTVLKNRGYDSAGLATMPEKGGTMSVTKFANGQDNVDAIDLITHHSTSSLGHCVGIAHTRWATHGGQTDENAHPHLDSSGKIALVHNGTLNNANELRRMLQEKGHVFKSRTDTEVIAKLIGHYYYDTTNKDKLTLKDATEKALDKCNGSWGLCVMCTDTPEELVVACNGSPLVIGIADDRTFVASETSVFDRYTKNFISMSSGEIGTIHADGRNLDLTRQQKLTPDPEMKLSPDPYPTWTIKECMEQPEAIARALAFGGRIGEKGVILGGLDNNAKSLSKIKHMTLSGCGTSLHAANYGERLMKSLGSFDTVNSIDAAETETEDYASPSSQEECGLLVISQSGETKDVYNVVLSAIEQGIRVLSVVNVVGSLIAQTTDIGVYCNAGNENSVVSTKTFSTEVTALALIALWFRQLRDKVEGRRPSVEAVRLQEALMRLPITFGMALKTRDHCRRVAERLKDKEHCFVLGKGYGHPAALEGALKIKEMSNLHAEGYSGGALKHGPFALIEDESGDFGATPIIMLILDDQHAHHMRTAAEEVRARGADLIIITDKPALAKDLDNDPIIIPSNGPMTALGAIVPMQLIAYELAIIRGINPDTPRNLQKVFR